VSYQIAQLPLFSLQTIASSDKYPVYDSLDEEVVKSYLEYSLASLIYYAMKEAACSEQSSRMSAMDNASKNAGKYPCHEWNSKKEWLLIFFPLVSQAK
jgi:F-type H+-transporting ATPase subunit gamma